VDRAAQTQAVRFVAVGVACAVLFFVVNFLAYTLSRSQFIALVAAYLVCFPAGYFLQRNFTFDAPVRSRHASAMPRYALLHLAGFLGVYAGSVVLSRYLTDNTALISALTTGLAGAASFFVSRLWVFAAPPAGPSRSR
jgi:putative flippase GtrA